MDLFRHPWALLWIPTFLAGAMLLRLWADRRRVQWMAILGRIETLKRLYPSQVGERRRIQFWLSAGGISFLLFAMAGPQWGIELAMSTARGLDVVVAVDTSLSMLTEDTAPNRIGKAKDELVQILDGLRGERVGIIAFAGAAYVQCPLTTDLDAAKSFLNSLKVGMVPQPGTALAAALDLGTSMLSKHAGHKAMVLITDGEDHMGHSLEAARQAAQTGTQIYIVGVGTPEGGPIPLRDDQGRVTSYKKDKKGNTVISRLGEESLVLIAKASSGAYFRATTDESEVATIVKNISQIERSKILTGSQPRYRNRYRLPLALAMLLLFMEMIIPESGSLEIGRIFSAGKSLPAVARGSSIAIAALAVFFFSGCSAEKSAADLWRGNRDYFGGRFERALERYLSAMQKTPKDPRPAFNAGDAQYKMQQWDPAVEKFSELADPKRSSKEMLPKALYNLGNTYYQKNELPKAVEAYKNCLLQNPKDEDCRFNLVKTIERMKQPPQKRKQQPQNQPKEQNQNNQSQPPPSDRSRPQSEMSQEDAERILQAVREKEKNAKTHMEQANPAAAPQSGSQEEDW